MADVQVKCINKANRQSTHEGITHLGGDGWRWTKLEVIVSIRNGTNSFFTQVNGKRANVEVREGVHGPYLQTHADGYWNDNLLALPECGAHGV